MLSKYYSEWILQLFIIWYLGYLLGIKVITKYINHFYATSLSAMGFIILIFYLQVFKLYKFEKSFLLVLCLLHFIPFHISMKNQTNNYSKENLLITLCLYVMYIIYIGKDPITIYLIDEHPKSWKELEKLCRSNEKNLIPLCIIFKIIKNIY